MDFLLIISTIFCVVNFGSSFNINPQPKMVINAENMGHIFRSLNRSSGAGIGGENFKVLVRDGNYLLIGARDAVYNLSIDTFTVQQTIEWPSTEADIAMCLRKSKSDEDCRNYITVVVKQNEGKLLICGTNAYKPTCRQYILNEDSTYQVQREFSGYAITPHDPHHNATVHYEPDTNELYAGSVSDFAGSDHLVYRKPLNGATNEMRTLRNDLKCLNDPNFVSSFSDDTNVFFWFRETAAEYTDHGKQVYGRVARVCKRDQGVTTHNQDLGTWTSFVKARLNCSLPGNVPFYFNELQSATQIASGAGSSGSDLIYGVFTTPYNGLQASAICAYSMDDIRQIFNKGAFKHQPDSNSLWLPIFKPTAPQKRPGSCETNSKLLSDDAVNFIQKNSLMYDAVPNFFTQPLLVDTNSKYQLTQIVAQKTHTADGLALDILYIGTSDGRVLKLALTSTTSSGASLQNSPPTLVASLRVFANRSPVTKLLVTSGDDARLVVASRDELRTLPMHQCGERLTCASCVRLRDPHCAWSDARHACVAVTDGNWPMEEIFIQNVRTGRASDCPNDRFEAEFFSVDELYAPSTSLDALRPSPIVGYYSAESMALALTLTVAAALLIGFAVGHRWSLARERRKHMAITSGGGTVTISSDESPPSDDDYEAPPSYKARAADFYASTLSALQHSKFLLHFGGSQSDCCYDTVAAPVVTKTANNNLYVKAETCNSTSSSSSSNASCCKAEKNLLPTLNNGTLPKDYKVKKVYL